MCLRHNSPPSNSTRCDRGPNNYVTDDLVSPTWPLQQISCPYFLTYPQLPMLTVPIVVHFPSVCCFCTFDSKSGVTRSSRVRKFRLQNRVQGATPVVLCGVVRYCRRNVASACCTGIPLWCDACSDYLTDCTIRSAAQLLVG